MSSSFTFSGVPGCSTSRIRVSILALLSLLSSACGSLTGQEPPRADTDARFASVYVSKGNPMACALESGQVYCWGGVIGDAGAKPIPAASSERARAVDGISDAIGITVGSHHACAIREGRTVVCWGDNTNGLLGTSDAVSSVTSLVTVEGIDEVSSLSAAVGFTCAVSSGQVYCWGEGYGAPDGLSSQPSLVRGSSDAVDVSVGEAFACLLTATGGVKCWGSNRFRELGVPELYEASHSEPVTVDLGEAATKVSAGKDHACAVLTSGRVLCWGQNELGQIGLGRVSDWEPPNLVNVPKATSIDAGSRTCIVTAEDEQVMCWGLTDSVDDDKKTNLGESLTPAPVRLRATASVSSGYAYVCTDVDNGYVECLGSRALSDQVVGSDEPHEVQIGRQ